MPIKPNLIGKKFGKLTVLKELPKRERKKVVWLVECYCGNTNKVKTNDLTSGNSQTCGCSHHRLGKDNPKYKGYKDIPLYYFNRLKRKKRNFTITIEQAANLLEKQNHKCALSGMPIGLSSRNNTASLDRIDSSKGYIKGNIQWVHKTVNRMKSDFNQKMFIDLCKAISKHSK